MKVKEENRNEQREILTFMVSSMIDEFKNNVTAMVDYLLYNGVVVLPCKVGDTVYYRTYKNNGSEDMGLQPHEVIGIKTIVQTKGADIPIEAFGKDVFMSRYEAERVE